MKDEVDAEIRRYFLMLLCVVVLFSVGWLCIRCSTTGVMYFKSRGIYPVSKIDSICGANALPRDLSKWRKSSFQMDDGTYFERYTFIEDVSGDSIKESIFTFDLLDSMVMFHHRQVK